MICIFKWSEVDLSTLFLSSQLGGVCDEEGNEGDGGNYDCNSAF